MVLIIVYWYISWQLGRALSIGFESRIFACCTLVGVVQHSGWCKQVKTRYWWLDKPECWTRSLQLNEWLIRYTVCSVLCKANTVIPPVHTEPSKCLNGIRIWNVDTTTTFLSERVSNISDVYYTANVDQNIGLV